MNDNNTPIKPAVYHNDNVIKPTKFEPAQVHSASRKIQLRVGAIVIAVALLASIATAWFVLTGKAVYIETVPENAVVEIHGGLKFQLADHFLIRPGD